MRIALVLAGLLAAAPAAAQQVTPSGRMIYGGNKTISCLQGGQVVIQILYARNVILTWDHQQNNIRYIPPEGGQMRDINFNSASMTCLIENMGQESVPIRQNTP